jgi:hypothetical protein
VSDVCGRILDKSNVYPGSTSDCLAIKGMSLFQKLETGMLAPGLCVFGNNAYFNTGYMAMPYVVFPVAQKTLKMFTMCSCKSKLNPHLEY